MRGVEAERFAVNVAEALSRRSQESLPLVLAVPPALEMSGEQFFAFCRQNRDWRIERTVEGEVEIMPPAGGETGNRNAILTAQLTTWALRNGAGAAFDSSTGFILPNGATRAPDAAWVRRERLASLTTEQKQKFLPLCPDFVIELRSGFASDSLRMLQEKMREYAENGARLGWLIDAPNWQVYIYLPGAEVERLDRPPELSGFVLDLKPIWETRL